MSRESQSILIVGAGVFGTSTAYHVKKTYPGWKVTVVDGTPSPPEQAASADINKIIRADYSVPLYSQLAYEAMEAWQSWTCLRPFYHRTGWIALGEENSDLLKRIRNVFKDRGHDPTSDVPLSEVEKKFKGILAGTATKGFSDAYWNPEAGWCEATDATSNLMAEAVKLGVEYTCGQVEQVTQNESRVTGVKLKDGTNLVADKTVFATGAWTSALLSPLEDELGVADGERVEGQAQAAGVAVAHYKMAEQEMEELSEMPVVVYGEHGEVIPPPSKNCLLKFTNTNTFTHVVETKSGGQISIPPPGNQYDVPEKLKRETEANMMNRVMPKYAKGRQAEYWRICWDARTPSQDWLLDKHPKIQNLYLAVGGSFHSYKFLPNIGKYMANVLNGTSNGAERDKAWKWKDSAFSGRGAHEKTAPTRDLKTLGG